MDTDDADGISRSFKNSVKRIFNDNDINTKDGKKRALTLIKIQKDDEDGDSDESEARISLYLDLIAMVKRHTAK